MGSVWEAMDERLHRPVAVKQLHAQLGLSPEETELANQRAMREARITARLHHRHAVPVFDVVEHQGRPCLIMQFLPSMALSAVLREGGPLTRTRGGSGRRTDLVGARGCPRGRNRAPRRKAGQHLDRGRRCGADHRLRHLARHGRRHPHGDRSGARHARFSGPGGGPWQRVDVRLRRVLTGVHDVRRTGGGPTVRVGLELDRPAPPGGIRGVPATTARRAPHPGRAAHVVPRPAGSTVHEGRGRNPPRLGRSGGGAGSGAVGDANQERWSQSASRPRRPLGPPPSPAPISAPAPSAEPSSPTLVPSPAAPSTVPNARPARRPTRRRTSKQARSDLGCRRARRRPRGGRRMVARRRSRPLVADQGQPAVLLRRQPPRNARGYRGFPADPDDHPECLADARTGTPTASQLAGAITNYYTLVPDNTDSFVVADDAVVPDRYNRRPPTHTSNSGPRWIASR